MPADFPQASLPSDFDSWLTGAAASSAELAALRASLKQSESEITLRKREGLPDFSIGYQGKIVNGGSQHGFGVSVSLPLWANRGRVKAAKALHAAESLQLASAEEQFRLIKKAQYEKARQLENSCLELQKFYTRIGDSNEACLKMALEKRTITTLEYLTVQQDFEAQYIKYIETRRDYLLARAELYAETL